MKKCEMKSLPVSSLATDFSDEENDHESDSDSSKIQINPKNSTEKRSLAAYFSEEENNHGSDSENSEGSGYLMIWP